MEVVVAMVFGQSPAVFCTNTVYSRRSIEFVGVVHGIGIASLLFGRLGLYLTISVLSASDSARGGRGLGGVVGMM